MPTHNISGHLARQSETIYMIENQLTSFLSLIQIIVLYEQMKTNKIACLVSTDVMYWGMFLETCFGNCDFTSHTYDSSCNELSIVVLTAFKSSQGCLSVKTLGGGSAEACSIPLSHYLGNISIYYIGVCIPPVVAAPVVAAITPRKTLWIKKIVMCTPQGIQLAHELGPPINIC